MSQPVQLLQVLSYLATLGREKTGEPDQPVLYHNDRRTHITAKELVPPWLVKVPPGGTETFSRMFDIPESTLPSTSFSETQLPVSWRNHQLDAMIRIKYHVKVCVSSITFEIRLCCRYNHG